MTGEVMAQRMMVNSARRGRPREERPRKPPLWRCRCHDHRHRRMLVGSNDAVIAYQWIVARSIVPFGAPWYYSPTGWVATPSARN